MQADIDYYIDLMIAFQHLSHSICIRSSSTSLIDHVISDTSLIASNIFQAAGISNYLQQMVDFLVFPSNPLQDQCGFIPSRNVIGCQ